MLLSELRPGVNVNIRLLQEANRAATSNDVATVYSSKIYDTGEDGTLELDVPTRQGKLMLLPQNVRYEFVFTTTGGIFKAEGIIDSRYKRGNFYLMHVRLTSHLEKHQRREFYRLSCLIPIRFAGLVGCTQEPEAWDDIEAYLEEHPEVSLAWTEGDILDISGGGLRAVVLQGIPEVTFALLHFSLDFSTGRQDIELPARVIAARELEGSVRVQYRFKFIFSEHRLQEKIIRYIFEEERRIRKKGQG